MTVLASTTFGVGIGASISGLSFGPPGVAVGALIGGVLGYVIGDQQWIAIEENHKGRFVTKSL